MNLESIDKTYNDYITLNDSLRITRRTINHSIPNVHNNTEFFGLKIDIANNKMLSAEQELKDLLVLSLFSNFERQLRNEIIDKSSKLNEAIPSELGVKLYSLACDEIEKWKIADVIDLFIYAVDILIIGNLKQVLNYRNWIAHGRNPSRIPAKIDPKTAYEQIKLFFSQIDNYQ